MNDKQKVISRLLDEPYVHYYRNRKDGLLANIYYKRRGMIIKKEEDRYLIYAYYYIQDGLRNIITQICNDPFETIIKDCLESIKKGWEENE